MNAMRPTGFAAPLHATFNSMSGDVNVRHPRRISARSAAAQPTPEPTPAQQGSQLEVLRALERGEIDVDEATRRLAGGA